VVTIAVFYDNLRKPAQGLQLYSRDFRQRKRTLYGGIRYSMFAVMFNKKDLQHSNGSFPLTSAIPLA
jgi:hypothetical protein